MKTLSLVLLLSFGASAQVPMMNFNTSSDNATVCNTTNTEQPNTDPLSSKYGKTSFLVMFHAIGCAGVSEKQTEVCNHQVVKAGQCASYHFHGGTSRRGAQICVPKGHYHADNLWNCGNGFFGGHLSFGINNDKQASVDHLSYIEQLASGKTYYVVQGQVNVK